MNTKRTILFAFKKGRLRHSRIFAYTLFYLLVVVVMKNVMVSTPSSHNHFRSQQTKCTELINYRHANDGEKLIGSIRRSITRDNRQNGVWDYFKFLGASKPVLCQPIYMRTEISEDNGDTPHLVKVKMLEKHTENVHIYSVMDEYERFIPQKTYSKGLLIPRSAVSKFIVTPGIGRRSLFYRLRLQQERSASKHGVRCMT